MASDGCLSDSYIYSLFAFVGSVTIFIALLRFLTGLRKFFLREGHDLAKRYGHGTWALVTAPTSATGNGFAVQLARLGFNIILVGKDIEKLHKVRDLLILRHNVKVRTVVRDFRDASDLHFYTELLAQIEDLDISVVVHAAGMAALSRKFHQQPAELNKQCLVTNMFAPVLLSQYLIPRLQHRYHKSAIVIVGGENAHQPIPGMAISSGAKAFLRHFAVAASVEYEDKIDVMTVQPLGVKKRMSHDEKPESILIVESERFARACLKQLGHERSTSGHWIHQLQSWAHSLFPEELKLLFWVKVLLPQHLKASQSASKGERKSSPAVPPTGYFRGIAEIVRKMK